jgi:hypothetical protein
MADRTNAERQRRWVARLKAQAAAGVSNAPTAPDHDALVKELAQAKQDLAQAKAQITELHGELIAQAQTFRDERARREAKPKVKKPPLPPDEERDRRIKAFTTANQNLRAQLRHMVQHAEDVQGKTGKMDFWTMSATAVTGMKQQGVWRGRASLAMEKRQREGTPQRALVKSLHASSWSASDTLPLWSAAYP